MRHDVSVVSRPTSCKSLIRIFLALLDILAVTLILFLCFKTRKGDDKTPSPAPLVSPVQPKIYDEADAPKGRFPYMCSIRKRESGRHICGGTQIDNQWVMTAAHCLDPDDPTSAGIEPFLYCGIYERDDQDTSKRLIPRRCYLHHLWDGNIHNGSDIALCQLDTSASVAVPDLSNIGDNLSTLDKFSVLGWGSTRYRGSFEGFLQIGEGLEYVLPSICNEVEEWSGNIKPSMICAGFASPNTCRGDSGGPLFIRHDPGNAIKSEDRLLDRVVGIASFGLPDCEADAPGVYTRVSCYRPWINCIMQGTDQDCSLYRPCQDTTLCSGINKSATLDETKALRRMRRAILSDDAEAVSKILCDGLSPNTVYGESSDSLLLKAAEYDAIKSARVLLEHGTRIEYKNSCGQAALSRAAANGALRVAQVLLENGASKTSLHKDGNIPLDVICNEDHKVESCSDALVTTLRQLLEP